jgi:hypothetical protein
MGACQSETEDEKSDPFDQRHRASSSLEIQRDRVILNKMLATSAARKDPHVDTTAAQAKVVPEAAAKATKDATRTERSPSFLDAAVARAAAIDVTATVEVAADTTVINPDTAAITEAKPTEEVDAAPKIIEGSRSFADEPSSFAGRCSRYAD